ncbi:YppG family protein [Oceanobacillus picturae]|uniref:YppG family protein n=1 Tax=Oceanobacillus picturae TaxID=171693 RepID=UPI0015FFA4DE|nr:YppG family protein [Oceanobacillus picturae]
MYHRPYDQYNNYYHPSFNNGINEQSYQPPQQPSYSIPPTNAAYQPNQFQTPYDFFSKPQQPVNWPEYMQPNYPVNTQQSSNIATGSNINGLPQKGETQLDLDKVLSTVGQIANTYHQVSPIVKQFGSVMKLFR